MSVSLLFGLLPYRNQATIGISPVQMLYFCTVFANNEIFIVCLSVCQLAYFLTEIRQIQRYLQFWMKYVSEILGKQSWDVPKLVTNIFKFFVCLSICQLAYFLTKIRPIQVYLLYWMRYLSEKFWRLSWNKFTINSNNSEFLVCLSVCQLAYFLTEIRLIWGYLQFWMTSF